MRPMNEQRPNVVFIICDDLGYSDIAAYGSEIPTPHLDRLAGEGTLFTAHHAVPQCSRTRRGAHGRCVSQRVGADHVGQ